MSVARQVGGIETRIGSLQSGLSKLLEAEKTVDTLTRDATVQRGELKSKQTDADAAMEVRVTTPNRWVSVCWIGCIG